MLTDPAEIAIIANAKQKNVRDPNRSREHFFNILQDFFEGVDLTGRAVDLGPGQFDFGELVRERGGQCLGIDFDPAVLELGRYKGFEVLDLNLKKLPRHSFEGTFDGVFNKFSLNAFWTPAPERHEAMVTAIADLVPSGWAWIAPWNGVPKSIDYSAAEIDEILATQRRLFEGHGFHTVELDEAQTRRYGVHGTVANNRVFLKNLRWRP